MSRKGCMHGANRDDLAALIGPMAGPDRGDDRMCTRPDAIVGIAHWGSLMLKYALAIVAAGAWLEKGQAGHTLWWMLRLETERCQYNGSLDGSTHFISIPQPHTDNGPPSVRSQSRANIVQDGNSNHSPL